MSAQLVQLERRSPLGMTTHRETTHNAPQLHAPLMNAWWATFAHSVHLERPLPLVMMHLVSTQFAAPLSAPKTNEW
jgi:hypothetical protein